VRPWGPAGYLLQPPTSPARAVASRDPLAAALRPHLRPGLPTCRACTHTVDGCEVRLPPAYDVQRPPTNPVPRPCG